MQGIYLNAEELAALSGLPFLVRELYVFGIRPRMDFSNGLVGVEYPVSWHGFARELRVEAAPGIKEVLPTKSQLRRAAEHLVKKGLITILSEGRQLIFQCVLARVDESVKNKVIIKPTHQPGTELQQSDSLESAINVEAQPVSRDIADTEAVIAKNQKPTHIRESEDSLSHHNAREVFSMHLGWRVDDGFEDLLRARRIDISHLDEMAKGAILDEFVAYWLDQPGVMRSQRAWEHKFCESVERDLRMRA